MIDHFGILAPFYERVIGLRNADRLRDLAGLPVSGLLLDVGGGTGRVTVALEGLAGRRVVIDESEGMLRQAVQKPGLEVAQGNSERLPFPDSCFDAVIMVDALHHIAGQLETCRELWRVLKPGGRIVIEEPDIRLFTVKLVALAEKLALMRSHFISPQVIQGMFLYPNARAWIEREDWNAWIVVEKLE